MISNIKNSKKLTKDQVKKILALIRKEITPKKNVGGYLNVYEEDIERSNKNKCVGE